MSDPIKLLTDTLTLLRVEIADVKKRQITEERLKHLQAALEDAAINVENVAEFSGAAAKQGAERLTYQMDQVGTEIKSTVRDAARSLSDAQRVIANSFLSQKRNIRLLIFFSALLGLLLGALGGVLIVDYKLGREFSQSIQGYGSDWRCENAGGEIYEQDSGTFCAIRINK